MYCLGFTRTLHGRNLHRLFYTVFTRQEFTRCLHCFVYTVFARQDGTPLHQAAETGDEAVVRALIDAGADVRAVNVRRGGRREGTCVRMRGGGPADFPALLRRC